jgi:hypothetical protein
LELLWKTHSALKRLRYTARVPTRTGYISIDDSPFDVEFDPATPMQAGYVDLIEPIKQGERSYIPLVRKSLDLMCSLDILFLRQEQPGSLILQGGDLDGRIKTLFDGLRMPTPDVAANYPEKNNPLYCLMESDTLVSEFDVDSDRLLMPESEKPNEVLLVIEVTLRLMRIGGWNACLMGD